VCTAGIVQGDASSTMFWALGSMGILEAAGRAAPDVQVLGLHDDVALAGEVEEVLQAHEELARAAGERGVQVQRHKLRLMVPSADDAQFVREEIGDDVQVQVYQGQDVDREAVGVVVGGLPVGHAEFRAQHVAAKVEAHRGQISRLRDLPDKCTALKLLELCAAPKFVMESRGLAPGTAGEALREHDDLVMDELEAILGMPLDEEQRTQARLPLREGGFGLTALADIQPLANLAAAADLAAMVGHAERPIPLLERAVRAFTQRPARDPGAGEEDDDDGGHNPGPYLSGLISSHDEAMKQTVKNVKHLGPSARGGYATTPAGIGGVGPRTQKKLVAAHHRRVRHGLEENASMLVQARLRAVRQKGAADLFQLIQSDRYLRLRDDQFLEAIFLRLGIDVVPFDKDDLLLHPCGHKVPAAGTVAVHLMSCIDSGLLTYRHWRLVRVLADLAIEAGCTVAFEPEMDPTGEVEKRADLVISGLGGEDPIIVDVTVCHDLAGKYREKAARVDLHAPKAAETRKIGEYRPFVGRWPNHSFQMAAVSVYGGLGPGMSRLLSKLAALAEHRGPRSFYPATFAAPDVLTYYRQRMAAALARGNYITVTEFTTGVPVPRVTRAN